MSVSPEKEEGYVPAYENDSVLSFGIVYWRHLERLRAALSRR
jgi:hypothetical protein